MAVAADSSLQELKALNAQLEAQIRVLDEEIEATPGMQSASSAYSALEAQAQAVQAKIDLIQKLLSPGASSIMIPGMPMAMERLYLEQSIALEQQISAASHKDGMPAWVEKRLTRLALECPAGNSFLAALRSLQSAHHGPFMAKAVSEYLFERKRRCKADAEQVAQLFADCAMFAEHAAEFGAPAKQAANYAIVWANLGQQVLDAELARQRQLITLHLERRDDWVSMNLGSIGDTVSQATADLESLHRSWKSALKPNALASATCGLYAILVDWFWSNLIGLPNIGVDDLPVLHGIGQRICSLALSLGVFDCTPPSYAKLACFVPLLQMSLIQISNAYRRNRIVPPLTANELAHAVVAMYAESPARASFLAELDEDRLG